MTAPTTIITWLGTGDAADIPDATTLNADLAAGAAARYYANDTGADYVLNRDTVAWDHIGGSGFASATPGSADDPLFSDGAGGFTAGTRSGNTTEVVTGTGSFTPGNLLVSDADGNAVDGGPVPTGTGDVTGPGSSVVGNIAIFDTTGGNSIDDSGIAASDVLVSADIGSAVFTQRTLTAPAAGITISNADGVSGNPTFALGNDLAALEAMSGTGLVARTASETYAQRTITGTSGKITVTNGDGVSGNPTLTIDSTYTGQTSITTLGTIGTGTWAGTTIAVDHGGTGLASYTQGDLLYASGSTTIATLAKNTSSTRYLSNTGASNNPAWDQVNLANGVTGTLPVGNGGTGLTSFTAGTDYATVTQAKTEVIIVAVSDETTAITTGTAKVTFRMPWAMALTEVRASLSASSSSGNPAIDINEGGVSIFSTTLTIDSGEKTSTTAATAAVISDANLADDAEMTVDIDTAGTGAKGLKIYLIGTRA